MSRRANIVKSLVVAVLVQLVLVALCATCSLSLKFKEDQAGRQELLRYRRSIASSQEDELTNRALPDLIALASTDKNLERKLVRLILDRIQETPPSYSDLGLTQQLARMQLGQQQPNDWSRMDTTNDLLANDYAHEARGGGANLMQRLRSIAGSGNIESAGSDVSNLEQAEQQQLQLQQTPTQIQLGSIYPAGQLSKREYRIKACSFNAVSCAKNPFRAAAKIQL